MEKYWPSLVGALVLLVAGFFLWPRPEPARVQVAPEPTTNQLTGVQENQEEEEASGESSQREPRKDKAPETGGEVQLIETVVAVPLEGTAPPVKEWNQDDPEVKAALSELEIEMFETQSCPHCEAAREFFSQNNISYKGHDIESDSWVRETLRRRAGVTSVPVIFIDGRMIRGFSVEKVQNVLTEALKKRLEGR